MFEVGRLTTARVVDEPNFSGGYPEHQGTLLQSGEPTVELGQKAGELATHLGGRTPTLHDRREGCRLQKGEHRTHLGILLLRVGVTARRCGIEPRLLGVEQRHDMECLAKCPEPWVVARRRVGGIGITRGPVPREPL